MKAFVFAATNHHLLSLNIRDEEDLKNQLNAQIQMGSISSYAYIEHSGKTWTITNLMPLEIQPGRIKRDKVEDPTGDNQYPIAEDAILLKGAQGKTLILHGDKVTIKKDSFLTGPREKVIPFRTITSVEVKAPGDFIAGFIQFSLAGGAVRDSSLSFTGGAFNAAGDENSVLFRDSQSYEIAKLIKTNIESWDPINRAPVSAEPAISPADEIRKFKALMDDGIITQLEFEAKKKQLLGF